MANTGVVRGYTGYFCPPYSILSEVGTSVYILTTQSQNMIIFIPLVPGFTRDILRVLQLNKSQSVYFIVPDFGVRYLSEYINLWYYIKHTLHRECKLFTKYLPETDLNNLGEELRNDIERNHEDTFLFSIPLTDLDMHAINIRLSKVRVATWSPYTCDVIVQDNRSKIFLTSEMNENKAAYLNDQLYDMVDEIHIPFIPEYHYGLSFLEVLHRYPKLINKLYAHSIHSQEEYELICYRRFKLGGLIYP